MATKRKAPPPPPPPPPQPPSDSSSDEVSSDEEEDQEPQSQIPNPNPEIDTGSNDSKKSDKEKMKAPAQSNGKSKGDYFKKVWSPDDELVLIQSLSDFYAKNQRNPSTKDLDLVRSSMEGKVSFDVTVSQIMNKLRVFKDMYNGWKKKGIDVNSLGLNAKGVFEISEKFWGGLHKEDGFVESERNGTIGTVCVKSESEFPYLFEAIDGLKHENQNLGKFYKFGFDFMDEISARDYEAKFKKQKLNEAKLCVMKMEMMNKLAKELTKLGG